MSADKDDEIIIRIDDEQFTPISTGIENAGSWEIKKTYVKESAYQVKGKTFITLQFPFRPGDHFVVGSNNAKYYIVSSFTYNPTGGYTFEIKRVSGADIIQVDLDILRKGAWAQVRGYFNNKQCK